MQYLALYRKFRPRTLSQVIRQEHIVKTLISQIENQRIGHAYLFCGPRGTGKTSVAKIFASAINCENNKSGEPCGKCPPCLALADPSNIDVTEIDAASNNRVDEIRDLREKVAYPPVSVKYKVYIIDEVHMLTDQAFNALLKTLEEPPLHAVFILATTEVQKLPATILSRCMRFDFKLIPTADIAEHIENVFTKSGKAFEKTAAFEIARAGGGSVRDALSIAEVCLSYSNDTLKYSDVIKILGGGEFSTIFHLAKSMLLGETGSVLGSIDSLIKTGRSAGVILKDLTELINAALIAATCKDYESMLSFAPEHYKDIKELSQLCPVNKLIRTMEIFSQTQAALRYTDSPIIVLETAAIKVSMPETDYNLDSVLARLSALEQNFKNSKGNIAQTDFKKQQIEPQEIDVTISKEQITEPKEVIDKDKVWGHFNILLRENKEVILRAITSELSASFEDDTLVIYADSEQKYNVLERADNKEKIKMYLGQLNCFSFKVQKPLPDNTEKELEKIKNIFQNINITVDKED